MAKVLVADDVDTIRKYVCTVVESMGHSWIAAENGKEAWEKYKNDKVDLSIVDINMPEMNGLDYLKCVKEVDPDAVVIIMTGYPSAETIVETIEDDGYTYITKPLQIERIKDLVEHGLICRESRLKNKQK